MLNGLLDRFDPDDAYRCRTCGRTYDSRPLVCHACGSEPSDG